VSKILISGGYVLSLDDELGELESADVLIEDGRIAAVGEGLETADAEVLDATGCVVMPGFIDTHRHTWQTPFRGICADWTLGDYFRGMRLSISPNCEPDDIYAGNYMGALEALDAGVTTIVDFSHANNSPEHADSALAGLGDAGIRAVFAYGYFAAPVTEPAFEQHADRLADARRLRDGPLSGDCGLVTMGVALTELGLIPFEQTIAEVESAREMGAPIVMHTGCVWGSSVTEGIPELDHHGLLGPDQVHVHCNTLDARDLGRLAENDCKVSTSPETEIQMGMGHPVIGRAMALGMRPSLSCDIASSNSGDLFSQMRIALQFERCMRNDLANARNAMPEALEPTVREALGWATVNGAHAIGREEELGSLTPGKLADVIVIGGERLNLTPMADPVGCLVAQANPSNVRDVLVAGRFAKRDGALVDVDLTRARDLAENASARVLAAATASGDPLLPPYDPAFDEVVDQMARTNLAGAWSMETAEARPA
jgi:cytosine/adenosine deaminase-related metal-dependent hydrolase